MLLSDWIWETFLPGQPSWKNFSGHRDHWRSLDDLWRLQHSDRLWQSQSKSRKYLKSWQIIKWCGFWLLLRDISCRIYLLAQFSKDRHRFHELLFWNFHCQAWDDKATAISGAFSSVLLSVESLESLARLSLLYLWSSLTPGSQLLVGAHRRGNLWRRAEFFSVWQSCMDKQYEGDKSLNCTETPLNCEIDWSWEPLADPSVSKIYTNEMAYWVSIHQLADSFHASGRYVDFDSNMPSLLFRCPRPPETTWRWLVHRCQKAFWWAVGAFRFEFGTDSFEHEYVILGTSFCHQGLQATRGNERSYELCPMAQEHWCTCSQRRSNCSLWWWRSLCTRSGTLSSADDSRLCSPAKVCMRVEGHSQESKTNTYTHTHTASRILGFHVHKAHQLLCIERIGCLMLKDWNFFLPSTSSAALPCLPWHD